MRSDFQGQAPCWVKGLNSMPGSLTTTCLRPLCWPPGDRSGPCEGVLHVVLVPVGPHVHIAEQGYGRKWRMGWVQALTMCASKAADQGYLVVLVLTPIVPAW